MGRREVSLVCRSNGPDGPLHTPCNNLQSDVSSFSLGLADSQIGKFLPPARWFTGDPVGAMHGKFACIDKRS